MFCNNCGTKIPNESKFCQNCGFEIKKIEDSFSEKNVENIDNIDNETCLLSSKKVNHGFGQGELYAYNNRLEYINKKGVKEICYFNEIKEVTTLGKVFTLTSKNIKSYSFGIIDGNLLEWINFVKDRVAKAQEQHLIENKENFEIVNQLIDVMKADRIGIIKAFSKETGLDLNESKRIVDEVFNQRWKNDATLNPFLKKALEKQEEKNKLEQLKKDKIPYCPKCHSTSLSANKKGFGFIKGALGMGLTGGVDIGMIAGGAGANKIILTCLNCGHQFKPSKK